MTAKHPPNIILASASPRRKQLLLQAGYEFKVCPSDIDESTFPTEDADPCEYAETLALAKAKNIANKFCDSLVLGADTIAVFNNCIIGKPADSEHARQITEKLFSAPHKVITGIALIQLSDNIEIVQSDTTIVYPKKMMPQQITRHIEQGSWKGKAGAYAIQETGDEFVEKIEGSLTNVMGLPMELLTKILQKITR